jgi:LytS/YehU family sensor histidine kinase
MYFIEQQEIIARNTDAEKLLREAELARLRQQLQPHFLFNSLNSISALAGSKPNEARKMIQGGGVALNKEKLEDPSQLITTTNLVNDRFLVVQKGKKNYFLLSAE